MARPAKLPSDEKNVKSIEKALNILLLFTQDTPELSHTEISKKMGWGTATTSRLLNTLQNMGFLIRDNSSGRYMLGGILYFLGQIAKKSTALAQICIPVMEKIRDETRETVQVFIREKNDRICFAQVEGNQSIRQSTEIGTREPLYSGATGIILLSHLQPEELGKTLAELKQSNEGLNLEQLLMQIAVARDQGSFFKKGDTDGTHIGCIAVPIFNFDRTVTSCLAISVPEFRFPDDSSHFLSLLKDGAEIISQELGYRK